MITRQGILPLSECNTPRTLPMTLLDYLPTRIYTQESSKHHLIYPFAIETNFIQEPGSFIAATEPVYCILFTISGSGTLTINNTVHLLNENTLVFLDCSLHHKFECRQNPWRYKIIFLQGSMLPFFYNEYIKSGSLPHLCPPYSSIPDQIEVLSQLRNEGILEDITRSSKLHLLFDELLSEVNRANNQNAPQYLLQIKYNFEHHYKNIYSLDLLEETYKISKYRICHEFSNQYHCSPIHYLNKIRIEKAKLLLLTTNDKIHEIGNQVGIDNTNHFIRLFKMEVGVSPLIYRKQDLT